MSNPRTKLKVEYNWGPRCWFFDEAMAAHDFNGTEHAIMYVVQRLTYSEPDWNRPGRRKEGARISIAEFKRRTGRATSAIQKAISSLEKANVLIVISRGAGRGNSSEYGINARIDEWKVERIGAVDEERYPGKKYPKKDTLIEVQNSSEDIPQLRYNNGEIEVGLGAKRGNFTTSELLSHKASLSPKEILRVKESTAEVLISSKEDAMKADPMDQTTALNHADRNYFRRFGQSLSPAEKMDLADYFELSEHKNSLLAIWLEILPIAFDERQAMRRDPDRARYTKGSPYKLARRMAGDRYAELKALKKSS